MNTREIAANYRLAHWAQIVNDQKTSGQTIKAFCTSVGVHLNVFFYWQRKLREAAACELAPIPQVPMPTTIPSGWTMCTMAERTGAAQPKPLTVMIGACQIRVDADTDEKLLLKVCKSLASLC
jgi:putative transposase